MSAFIEPEAKWQARKAAEVERAVADAQAIGKEGAEYAIAMLRRTATASNETADAIRRMLNGSQSLDDSQRAFAAWWNQVATTNDVPFEVSKLAFAAGWNAARRVP